MVYESCDGRGTRAKKKSLFCRLKYIDFKYLLNILVGLDASVSELIKCNYSSNQIKGKTPLILSLKVVNDSAALAIVI